MIRIPEDADRGPTDGLSVEGRQLDRIGGDHGDLVVLEATTSRVWERIGDVGRHEHLARPSPTTTLGALLGGDQPVGCRRRDDADGVRAGDFPERGLDGAVGAAVAR